MKAPHRKQRWGEGAAPLPQRHLKVLPSAPFTLFRCVPLGTSLTPESCGARHKRSKHGGTAGVARYSMTTCIKCPVGAAHARGRKGVWASGEALEHTEVQPLTGTRRIER